MAHPVALILDNVHTLRNRECIAAIAALADHIVHGSKLILCGRGEPPIAIARLRAEGRILEIGTKDLSLTGEEATELLSANGLQLSEDEETDLLRQRSVGSADMLERLARANLLLVPLDQQGRGIDSITFCKTSSSRSSSAESLGWTRSCASGRLRGP